MGGSAIDGLIFADFRATNPLVVQISLPFRPVQSVSPVVGPGGRAAAKSVAGRLGMHAQRSEPGSASLKTNQYTTSAERPDYFV